MKTMYAFKVVSLLTILLSVGTVDRSNFKTCDQSSFCKRHRHLTTGQSQYFLQMNTVQIEQHKIQGHLVHGTTGVVLKLEVYALKDGIFHLRVDEMNPIRPRYEPKESFAVPPKIGTLKIINQDDKGLSFTSEGNKIVIIANPFRLDAYSGEQLVISANPRGLFKFEAYRHKTDPNQKPEGEENKVDEKPVEEENQDGLWEESFKGHSDSKPYGPSSIGMDFTFVGFEHVYGIPEHADSFALKQTKGVTEPYRLYNLDVFEYELYNPMALYGQIPYMIAHSASKTVGMLWLNAAETWVDIEAANNQGMVSSIVDYVKGTQQTMARETHWISESGVLNAYFLLGPTPKDVMRQYTLDLSGTTPLPPQFAIAYHQCRWNYIDQDDVRNVDAGFDEHDIPYDVIWLDVDHTDNRKYFTWEPNKFPTPEIMLNNITAKGRKMVTLIDPHIKKDSSYYVNNEAVSNGYYVKNKNGDDYEGWCWPGSSGYVDLLNPEVRDWWATKFLLDQYKGSTLSLFTWNDMNEPSVFNGPEITMPKDNKHFGGWEHRDIHGIYGLLLPMSTYKGHLLRSNGQHRPFILSRAMFVGSQRFGAVWTGDNTADWGHLTISLPMILSLSVSGLAFSGADVGGFFRSPDSELLVRWYQAGAFQPFFRAHAHIDSKRREPWLFDEASKLRIRDAIRHRYAFLPYWYTLFYENEVTGVPPFRPLWMEFPQDEKTFSMDNEHLIGAGLLVRPVTEAGVGLVTIYFPGDKNNVWYDLTNHRKYYGGENVNYPVNLDTIPLFQRGGTIIPKKERIRRSSSLGADDPYTLVVALKKIDGVDVADGTLYVDDGYSNHYRNGDHLYIQLDYKDNSLTSKVIKGPGNFKTKAWLERVVVMGVEFIPKSIQINSKSLGKQELRFSYQKAEQILVIRRPGPNMAEEWNLQLIH